MESSRKIGIIVLIALGISIFGYSQYASASHVEISIAESNLLAETDEGSNYDVAIEFNNPSLLILPAGEIEFFVISEDEMAGKGKLSPFILQPLSSSYANGTFQTYSDTNDDPSNVTISGITRYDMFFTSIDVPFVYHPTDEQAREFIHPD